MAFAHTAFHIPSDCTGMPPHKLDANLLAPLTAGIGETRKVMSVQANFVVEAKGNQ
jgi:hypothetical protein